MSTSVELVKQRCKEVNADFERRLSEKSTFSIPMEISSNILYKRTVGPIEMGFENEFMNGDFDDIIEESHTEIYEKFIERAQELELMPTMSFDEFAGPEFAEEPKISREELEKSITYKIKHIEQFARNPLRMPDILLDGVKAQLQEELSELMAQHKSGDFAVTDSEINYIAKHAKKFGEYNALFKV